MIIPKSGTRRRRILDLFSEHGGMNFEVFVDTFGLMGYEKPHEMRTELQTLINHGCLRMVGNVYFSTMGAKEMMTTNLVPSREPKPFTPLKSYLPKESPRGQAIGGRSFKHLVSNVKPTYNNKD